MLNILLAPFELLIQLFYSLNLLNTGNHGLSLLLLSLEISLISLPLYILAEKWKSENEALQTKMDPVIDEVKEVYSGQKRYYLVQEIHRIFGYGGLNTLKVSFGLLIQIPFFFAAYNYLSAYTGYGGVSFLIFEDLSKADGLMGGIHLLPFLMTVVNLIGSFLYLKGRKRSDKLQLIIIALLFLVLLYDRPAALLLYWTMNNILAVPKNQLLRKLYPPVPVEEEPLSWSKIRPQLQATTLASVAILLLIISAIIINDFTKYSRYWLVSCFIASCVLTITYAFYTRRKNGNRAIFSSKLTWFLFVLWVAYIVLFFDWITEGFIESNFPTRPKRLFISLLSVMISYLCSAVLLVKNKIKVSVSQDKTDSLAFLMASGLLFYLFFFYSPLQTFSYAAVELKLTLGRLIISQGTAWLLFTAVTYFIYSRLGRNGKQALNQAILFLLISSIVYYFFLRKDYGALSGNILSGAGILNETSLLWFLFDGVLLTFVFYISRLIRIGRGREIAVLSFIVSVGLVGQNVFSLIQSSQSIRLGKEEENKTTIDLPPESDDVHRFTRTGTNTVLIVGDMFTAGLMEPLLEENPQWFNQLKGFTWYPDTLSVATSTYTAMPAILGGWEFAPLVLNERPGTTLEKNYQAYGPLLYTAAEIGASVSLVNPEVYDKRSIKGVKVTKYKDYVSYWNSKHPDEVYLLSTMEPRRLLTMVGIFYGSPHFCRKSLYSDGFWSIFPTKNALDSIHREVKEKWVYLDLLPALSKTTDDIKPQVKYIHNNLPHLPYGIDPNGMLIREGSDGLAEIGYYTMDAAYYSAREFIDKLIIWFEWMKREGVYDNTQIIIVSDHGVNIRGKDPMEPSGFSERDMSDVFAASHALLMHKPVNAIGELKIDPALMSNADCFSLLAPLLDIPVTEQRPMVRSYSERAIERREIPQSEYVPYNTYKVNGSIFDIDAWTVE